MAKKLLTEQDVLSAVQQGKKILVVEKGTILTPSAQDAIRQHKISISDKDKATKETEVVKQSPIHSYHTSPIAQQVVGGNLIVVGSDHGGFQTKEVLKKYLTELGYRVLDIGAHSEEPCDYPDYAYAVARIVSKGEAWRGIMIDATGVASAIVCNKVPGVRAVSCYNEFVAQSSREHNDANVLTLGAKALGIESMKSIVKVWLDTWFGGGRHKRRVDKISDIERRFTNR